MVVTVRMSRLITFDKLIKLRTTYVLNTLRTND